MNWKQPPSSSFRWNVFGWFGAQVGGTLWLFAIALSARNFGHSKVALVILLLAVFANILGIALWLKRKCYSAYFAIQLFMATLALITFLVLLMLDATNIPFAYKVGSYQSDAPTFSPYWLLLMFPALMLMFHFNNRQKPNQELDPAE